MSGGQSRWHSVVEAWTNILVGFGINSLANFTVFPLFGWHINARQNLALGVIYTVISFARSFVLRRVFNRWHVADAMRAAK